MDGMCVEVRRSDSPAPRKKAADAPSKPSAVSDEVLLEIPFLHLEFRFYRPGPVKLPQFLGASWRDAMGGILRRNLCSTGAPSCAGCPEIAGCGWSYVWETSAPPPEEGNGQPQPVPRPFCLTGVSAYQDASATYLEVGLRLFGDGTSFANVMIESLRAAGVRGFEPDRLPFRLHEVLVQDDDVPQIAFDGVSNEFFRLPSPRAIFLRRCEPAEPDVAEVTLEFLSATRIVSDKRVRKSMDFRSLMKSVLRRVSLMGRFHGSGDPPINYKELIVA